MCVQFSLTLKIHKIKSRKVLQRCLQSKDVLVRLTEDIYNGLKTLNKNNEKRLKALFSGDEIALGVSVEPISISLGDE